MLINNKNLNQMSLTLTGTLGNNESGEQCDITQTFYFEYFQMC